VLRKDLTHRFTHGNPAALKELNVSLADLRGKSDEDYFPPSLVRRYLEGDNKILVEGLKRVEWIERHGLIDSKLALVHMIKEPLYDAQGELAGVQVIYWDVENRKAVIDAYKKAFEQLEADYRAIVNYAVEGIYRSTLNGRYLEANDRLAHIYGYSDRKNLIDSITDIRQQLYLDPADRDRFMNEIGLPPYEVRDFAYRVWRVEKDGRRSPIWISENARAVRNEKNEILYYEGFISDITDKKWFEDTLNVRATRQAIEIMVKQLKHDFSHALDSVRAKLIQLKWKNLLRKPPWTVFAERNKAWRNLPVSIEFAQALFNNFYHKRNGHDLSLNRESFESIINISWAIASSMAESKKVKFTLHYEPDVPEILLDKWILAQVFVNLFLNSIAAIPQDRLGQITVKVRVDVREWAYKSALETEFGTQTVIVEIQDNGKGLSKEQQTTLDKPVPPKSTTGWGLWIVRKNLRLHNSEMVLDSVLNHGTKVTLTFRVP
jgi:PAS domain S-box-containing protein